MDWFTPCLNELTKISVSLTIGEKRRQALQFAGLGVATIPALAMAQSKIQSGKWFPKGMSRGRVPGAAALGGAFWGGALPAARRYLAKGNIEGAKERVEVSKELKSLAPGGVKRTLATLPPAPMPSSTLPPVNHV